MYTNLQHQKGANNKKVSVSARTCQRDYITVQVGPIMNQLL